MNAEQHEDRRIELKGKYLQTVMDYVSTLSLEEEPSIPHGKALSDLAEMMVKLHPAFLTKLDALTIIFSESYSYAFNCEDRYGALSASGNEDLFAALTTRIKRYIESLPRSYIMRFQLPSFPKKDVAAIELAPDVKLLFNTTRVTPSPVAGVLRSNSRHGEACLELTTVGYGNNSAKSPAAATCISLAKQCVFVLEKFGVCSVTFSTDVARATFGDGPDPTFRAIDLPEGFARALAALKLRKEKLLVSAHSDPLLGSALAAGRERAPRNEDEEREAIENSLTDLRRFLSVRSHSDFGSIAAAIEWYQDSQYADNQTFSYLAACIGLEALLGSEHHIDNLSKRLADRYAFLLGTGRAERDKLIAQYGRVLTLRGKLVHAKAARLPPEDQHLLQVAQDMLLKAIWHELHRIYKSD